MSDELPLVLHEIGVVHGRLRCVNCGELSVVVTSGRMSCVPVQHEPTQNAVERMWAATVLASVS
jgi:hypothetical protein